MKPVHRTIYRIVTAVVATTVLILAGYIVTKRLGLVEGYDFGLGAYYYVDIPEYEKIINEDAYQTNVPVWIHCVLFAGWGWLMWLLWNHIDKKS